jgi:hypothetical protein
VWAVVYYGFVYLPAMNAFFDAEQQNAGQLLSMTMQITRIGLYVVPVLMLSYFIYPTLVLAWMLRPRIAEALRKGGIEAPDDYAMAPQRHEPEDYDDRRRPNASGEGGEGIYCK